MLLTLKKSVILILLTINANTVSSNYCRFGIVDCVNSCRIQYCVCSHCNQVPNKPRK